MYENIFSMADLITLVLSLAACAACYFWGVRDGVIRLAQVLLETGKINQNDLDDL